MSSVPPPNATLVELSAALGDESARELVDMYLANFPTVFKELSSGDREQRRRAAHSLKSSSNIVGAQDLSAQMAALEARLTDPSGEVTSVDLTAATTEFDRIAVPLRAYAQQAP